MKLLVITEKDAANTSLGFISNAFIKKGHEVKIYASYYEGKLTKCFGDTIEKYPLSNLSKNEVQNSDLILCSTLSSIYLPDYVFSAPKPIFTHNYLMNRQINWGGDVCFAPSVQTVASDYDEYLNYSYVGIGEPKYDSRDFVSCNGKRFLFIDSGHYPFSQEGKKELARTLIDICHSYPDYELWIKPRFLPGDKVITHRNDIHLYDVICSETNNTIPANMVMLDYHEDLKKLIDQSSTVICMYTTAFVGAVVAGKGLVVLENLKTTDVYDIRHKTYMRNRENIIRSGALIDYRDVKKLLPDGVKGSKEYLDFLLDEKECVADKICEVCEYLYENFYSRDRFPKKCSSTYKDYKRDFVVDDEMTWERLISQRYYDYMMLKSLILIDFHVKSKLDVSHVLKKINGCLDENGLIQEDVFREFLRNANDVRDNCIICNRETMLQDEIDAGILLNAYYLQNEFEEIREFPIKDIAAYDMYRAFIAVEDEEEQGKLTAKKHLIQYFDKCINREYNLEISDMSNNKFKAYEMLIKILLCEKDMGLAKYYIEMLNAFYRKTYMVDLDFVPINSLQKKRYEFILQANAEMNGERI